MIRIGINGFGRIGRALARVIEQRQDMELVAINDLAALPNLAHLLKYDSTHRQFPGKVTSEAPDIMRINDSRVKVTHQADPAAINWKELHLDVIVESTGLFRSTASAKAHLQNAPKVIISAPPQDEMPTVVLGINDSILESKPQIISNASCTTNSAAPLLQIIDKLCGVEHAYITTVHSYTTDQQLQDGPHNDYRRGRAAAESIVPTTTGAAKAITRIFPALQGKIGGAGIRVPVPDGSLTDITFTVKNTASVKEINKAFEEASQSEALQGILGYNRDPIVSRDVIGSPYSCLFDEELTSVLGKMVKVVGWYDNEMGYSNRLADLALLLTLK